MRAVVTTESGGPEVLTIGEVADPRPAAGEVVVEVVATVQPSTPSPSSAMRPLHSRPMTSVAPGGGA